MTVNSATGAVTKDVEYYTLGHYSKYVWPGATRIYTSSASAVTSVGFRNPDGSMAIISFNNSIASQTFWVPWGMQSFSYNLAPPAAVRFTWRGAQSGVPEILATWQIQGSSCSSESGSETETTGVSNGAYDLGYVSQGAAAVYENVDFGASVSGVIVRVASGGNGGTLEFHLDSAGGSLIGTATLPVTDGWQSWETVSAPITEASGLHNLNLVFHSSSIEIANLNWFQFN